MASRCSEVSILVYRLVSDSEGGGLERLNYYQISSPTHGVLPVRNDDGAPQELTHFVRTLKISLSPRKYHLQELAPIIQLEEWELEEINAEEEGLRQSQETRQFREIGTRSPQVRNDVAREDRCSNAAVAPPPPVTSVDTPDKSHQRRAGATRLMTPLKKFFAGSKNKHSPALPPREEPNNIPHQHIPSPSTASREELLLLENIIRSKRESDCRTPPPKASRLGRQSPNDERAYNLLEFIRSLINLENLIFEWTPSCGISDDCNAIGWYLPPLYRSALEASGDGSFLKSLTVNVEMGCWKQVLHQSLVFARLERFTVHCRSGWCCCAEAASVLVPFIQRHKERLRELVVVSKECQLGGLWGEVGFIPGLRRLEVEETPRRCDPSRDGGGGGGNLWGFLEAHSGILTQISWRLSDANLTLANRDLGVWFSKDRELIHFPRLRVLELQGLQQLPPHLFFNPVLRYLRTLHASLTTLKIHGWKLMPDPFIDILEAVESPLITVLDVGLEKLTSDLFVEMETLLPGLRVLKIVYREAIGAWDREDEQQPDSTFLLSGDPMGGGRAISDAASTMSGRYSRTTSAVKRFIDDMELREFTEWEVEELMIRCTRVDRFARDPHWRAKRVGKAVLNALPSVTEVNGVTREEYLREVEECDDFIPDLP